MAATYVGDLKGRELRILLSNLSLAKEEIDSLKYDAARYRNTPRQLSLFNLTFYFFTKIYHFYWRHETIILGLLSNGTIHYNRWYHDTHKSPTMSEFIRVNNLWSLEFKKFVDVAFLKSVLEDQLDPYYFSIVMKAYRDSDTTMEIILRNHLWTVFTSALNVFLEEVSPHNFNPENPAGIFNQFSLYEWLQQYYYLPLQHSQNIRDEVAAKFAFEFDPVRQVFFKRNDAHELVVDLSGNVFIDSQSICITFKTPTTLPTNDIIACKFFALGDPALRRQIATLTNFQSLLEDMFHEKSDSEISE